MAQSALCRDDLHLAGRRGPDVATRPCDRHGGESHMVGLPARSGIRVAVMTLGALVLATGATTDRMTPLSACGPFFDFTVYTPEWAPELDTFLSGRLGILQPTYGDRYLLAAWRTLKGKPLTAIEQQAYRPKPSTPD